MRTKSLRMASAVSSSTILVPVRPPVRPVATTGTSRSLSARGVDPFPAGKRQNLARAVPVADLEHGHRERPVESGVDGNGDDHVTISHAFAAVVPTNHQAFPSVLGSETDSAAIRFDDATLRSPSHTSTRPSRCPARTGSATRVGWTVLSSNGVPSLTVRTSVRSATSSERRLVVARIDLTVHAARVDDRDPAVAVEAVLEQRSERGVAIGARVDAEDRHVHRCPTPRGRGGLGPAGSLRMARLPAHERRPAREQVVGGREVLPTREREARNGQCVTDQALERVANQDGRVPRARLDARARRARAG